MLVRKSFQMVFAEPVFGRQKCPIIVGQSGVWEITGAFREEKKEVRKVGKYGVIRYLLCGKGRSLTNLGDVFPTKVAVYIVF